MIKTYTKGKAAKLTRNFKAKEFDCKCGGKECKHTLIDDRLLEHLQQIRNHFGKAVIINSGYRCYKHNKAVGGAVSSRHMRGQAADIIVKGIKPRQVAAYAETLGIKGIGLYSSFVHIDTRTYKYYWFGSQQERRTSFK